MVADDFAVKSTISIHALLAESDFGAVLVFNGRPVFLSTLSLRRATLPICKYGLPLIFLSTLSLRRATKRQMRCEFGDVISIHALLAESDTSGQTFVYWYIISIHALLAESDCQ